MTYVMSSKMYWGYIVDKKLSHEELITYLNSSLIFRGTIKSVQIVERG
jgi:hypothetical protein